MPLNQTWPQIDLPSPVWTDAYEHGWADLARRVQSTVDKGLSPDAWTVFCARYLCQQWPLIDSPSFGYANKMVSVAQAYWLEWTLFGHCADPTRLEAVLAHDLAEDDPFNADPLRAMVALQSATWMCEALGRPRPGWVAKTVRQTRGRFHLLPPLDQRLAQLWADPDDLQEAILRPLLDDLHILAADRRRLPTIIDRCLLLIQLLHHGQEHALAHALAVTAAEGCSRRPSMYLYLPPLLLDGVLGLIPSAAESFLTCYLPDAFTPRAVTRYAVGSASVSLRAKHEIGAGDQIHVVTDAPLTLEIVTEQRSYVEALAAGEHQITLTVLDRTDVMPNS